MPSRALVPANGTSGLGQNTPAVETIGAQYRVNTSLDFLRNNVLRNQDIVPVIRSGFTTFDRTLGAHKIPLSAPGKQFTADGSLTVPDTQTLVVTDFQAFAGLHNPGLPGSYVMIDPLALVGQVVFHLVAGDGQRLFGEINTVQGRVQNGVGLVGLPTADGFPALTDSTQRDTRAVYEVLHQPLPGYPSIVGVRLKGYLVSTTLLESALSSPVG